MFEKMSAKYSVLIALSVSHSSRRNAYHFSSVVSNSCDPLDCSLPGSSVHGIFQARVLEWVAIAFSGSFHDHVLKTWFSAENHCQRVNGRGWSSFLPVPGFSGAWDPSQIASNKKTRGLAQDGRVEGRELVLSSQRTKVAAGCRATTSGEALEPLAREPKSQLAVEQPSAGRHWNPPEKEETLTLS